MTEEMQTRPELTDKLVEEVYLEKGLRLDEERGRKLVRHINIIKYLAAGGIKVLGVGRGLIIPALRNYFLGEPPKQEDLAFGFCAYLMGDLLEHFSDCAIYTVNKKRRDISEELKCLDKKVSQDLTGAGETK